MSIEKGKISCQQLLFLFAGFIEGSALLIDFTVGIAERPLGMEILAVMIICSHFIPFYLVFGS